MSAGPASASRVAGLGAPRLHVLWGPLFERLKLGEGALFAVNAAIVWFESPAAGRGAAQLVVSLLVLAVLYAYNDLQDAPDDVRNPKKNQQLVRTLHEGRRRLFPWLYGWMLGLVAVAGLLVDAQTALLAVALFAVNALYSHLLKGQPILDLLVVGAWGGLYAALAAPPWRIALAVGLMTSVMHVFQTLVDRDVDAANHVRTTAVVSRYGATAALVLAGAALYVALLPLLGPALALSAFLPLALRLLVRRTGAAWMLSRLYCAVTLIAALRVLHGSS